MQLAYADKCAAKAMEWLGQFAVKAEIAGSVRRRRPECSDLDVVMIPKWRELKDLMGVVIKRQNLAADEIRRRVKAEGWTMRSDGEEIRSFTAGPAEAWGSVLLCRTGSQQHNIRLAEKAKALGGKWHPTRGLYLHGRVIGESEEAIFEALGLAWVAPAEREVGGGR